MHCIIKGVKIIDPTSPYHLTVKSIRISDGIITKIADDITDASAEVFTFNNACVSIGWMDSLASFGDPGHEYKETFSTGTAAAAAGGFTAVGLMPNTEPALHSKSEIEYIVNKSATNLVNIYPYGAVTKNRLGKDLTEIYDMYHAGAIAFTDADAGISDDGIMLRSLQYVKPFNGVIIDVPNDHKVVGNAYVNEGAMSVQLGMYGIPDVLEELMVIRDIKLAAYCDSNVHLGVISSAKCLPHIREAKKEGIHVTAGVAAYQIYFNETVLEEYDTNFKVNPPLRTSADNEALIAAIVDGTIDVICSNHLPHENDAKMVEFEYAAFGMASLETAFSAAWQILHKEIKLEKLIQLIASNPRKILNIPTPQIIENTKAELTIFDADKDWVFSKENIRSKSINTAFVGQPMKGKVLAVINNNQIKMT